MNGPGGTPTDPLAAMASPSWPYQVVHVLLSCYQATAWAMVAIHAVHPAARSGARRCTARRWRSRCRSACLTALVQPLSGDRSAKHLAVAQPLKLAAAEAHLHTGRARGAARRRHSRSRDRRVPRRAPDPRRPVVPGVRRPRRDGHRAGGVPARRLAAGRRVRTAFQVMVGRGQRDGAGGARGDRRCALAPAPLPDGRRWLMAFVVLGPLGLRQPRGRLAGHRVGAAAVDRPRADAHRGGGDRFLQGGAVLAVHDRLPLPRRGGRLPAGAQMPAADDRTRGGAPCRTERRSLRGRDRRRARASTSCSAAPTSAAASGICWRAARARRAQRAPIAARDRPGVGGEPRLADPGRSSCCSAVFRRRSRRSRSRCTCR